MIEYNKKINICTKCGTQNPLMARYCYQCGEQIKEFSKPIVCTKCNTVNAHGANFCKRCGNRIAQQQTMKYCPSCHQAIPTDSSFCPNCRYDYTTGGVRPFQNYNQIETVSNPVVDQQSVAAVVVEEKNKVVETAYVKPQKQKKYRFRHFFAMLVVLAGAWLALMPDFLAVKQVNFGAMYIISGGVTTRLTGYDLVEGLVQYLLQLFGVGSATSQLSIYMIVISSVYLISSAILLCYFITALVRVFSGKRAKHANFFSLAWGLLSGAVLITVPLYKVLKTWGWTFATDLYVKLFGSSIEAVGFRWGIVIIPATFLVLFVLSLMFKEKKSKEKKVESRIIKDQRP